MKLRLFSILAVLLLACSCAHNDPVERRINKIVGGLSLEEKVGQMVQLNSTVICSEDFLKVSEEGEAILRRYKIGSILNTPSGKGATTPEAYRSFINDIQRISMDEMGIPCIYGLDQIHGASYTTGATFFPQEINLAATYDERHAFMMGNVLAYETRACNVPWVFSPVLDLGRNSAWPRMWESFGEDAIVNKKMGVSETLGQQGGEGFSIDEFHTGVSLKHFMAYGVPVSGQDRTPSNVSKRELMEMYFQPFKACCEAGALSIMVNSAMNDGIPFHMNRELLTEWVKEGLNWDGFIVTDWADVKNLCERDHVAQTEKEAVKLAVNAGIDMIMDPYTVNVCDYLVELCKEGYIKESRIDDAARRIIRAKMRLGLFDDPYGTTGTYEDFACEKFKKAAYEAAVESEILLKNTGGILPLDKNTRILVVGPNANSMRTLNGGWSYSWQGDRADELAYGDRYNTILEALRSKFANVEYEPVVTYDFSGNWQKENVGNVDDAIARARRCDVIIACIGENSYCETPGNIVDLNLSEAQKELVKSLAKCKKPIILVLNEGRPRLVADIENYADAVVDVMLPGNYGGDALAALLCGEENFSGKLPFTYPKYPNRLATYDYLLCENRSVMQGLYNYDAKMDVQWNFGDGMSYTRYSYSNLRADKTSFRAGDTIDISIDVTNSGEVAGKESVLLFSSDIYASITPKVRRLCDFEKVELKPGETKTVGFELKAEDLAFVGHDLKWHLEEGDFRLSCADQSIFITCVR